MLTPLGMFDYVDAPYTDYASGTTANPTGVQEFQRQAEAVIDTLTGGGTGPVISFNLRSGVVSPLVGDYSAFYEPLNAKLTAISVLANAAGLLRNDGAGLFSYDTASYQPLDADLTAIAGISATSGLLKKTAADTWSLDTSTYATQAYADALVLGLLDDRGNYNASGNVFPSSGGSGTAGAILKGDLWSISVAGTLGGHPVTAGDVVRALTDTPGQTDANWAIAENNFGYVALNQALADGKIYVGNASGIGTAVTPSGDVTISNAGVTAIGALKVLNSMIANATIDLAAKVTGILPSANGGTGNGFTKFSGPATSEKTFTLPNASDTIATYAVANIFTANQSITASVDTNLMFVVTNNSAGTNNQANFRALNDLGRISQVGIFGSNKTASGAILAGEAYQFTNAVGLTVQVNNAAGVFKIATGGTAEKARWDATGNLGLGTTTPRKKIDSLSTSQAQLRLTYTDDSVYSDFTVGSGGNLTVAPTGDLVFDPTGNDILPATNYDLNIGALASKYLTLHAAELWAETLVAQNTLATIGGRIIVAPTTPLSADLAAAGTTITTKYNNLLNGDRVYMEANGKVEFMAVTSSAGGSAGAYTYSVTRNLDGSGANDWFAGDAIVNTGTTGNGFIDLYSVSGVLPGSTAGPTIVGNVRTGTTYNNIEPRWAIGNLNGLYGYSGSTYGAAFGSPSAAWLKIDPTNGVRIGHNATTVTQIDAAGNAYFSGAIAVTGSVTAGAGKVTLDPNGLYFTSNTASTLSNENALRWLNSGTLVANIWQTYGAPSAGVSMLEIGALTKAADTGVASSAQSRIAAQNDQGNQVVFGLFRPGSGNTSGIPAVAYVQGEGPSPTFAGLIIGAGASIPKGMLDVQGSAYVASNLGIGTNTFGTSADKVLALFNGTVPSTSPADTVQLFSVDISAGNASLGIRTETAAVVAAAGASDVYLNIKHNGTTYKLLLHT